VISGKTIGCLGVDAPGVVIRNSKISCGGGYAVFRGDVTNPGTPLVIEDSEISCGGGGTAIGEANVTALRLNIHDCENGFDVNENVVVEDSYIHDLYSNSVTHTDGIQTDQHLENGNVVPGTLNLTVKHNTIFATPVDTTNSAIITWPNHDQNVSIENNLMAGGGYTLYCPDGAGNTGIRVVDNHFTTRFSAKVGYYAPGTGCDPAKYTVTGNVIHETGAPANLR
jgi:hypothetical protein